MMTLAQFLVIASVAAIYALVGKWLIRKMIEEERRSLAAGRRPI